MPKIYNMEATFKAMWDNPPLPAAEYRIGHTNPPEYRRLNPDYDPEKAKQPMPVPPHMIFFLPERDMMGDLMGDVYESLGIEVLGVLDKEYKLKVMRDDGWTLREEEVPDTCWEIKKILAKNGKDIVTVHTEGRELVNLTINKENK